MSFPTEFDNEINALTREFAKQRPSDTLQFCANYFNRRLEAQRAEFQLASTHSAKKGSPGMAESNFPGTNPFGASSTSNDRGMQRVDEEDEHDDPPSAAPRDTSSNAPPAFTNSFGSSGFAPSSKMAPLDGSSNLPTNYNFNRRTSVSAESMNPADADNENWKPPFHPKTPDQQSRLRKAVATNFIFSHLDDDQTNQVLGALNEKPIPAKDMRVIAQGDEGDWFYVVEKGNFDVYVSSTGKLEAGSDGQGKKVNTIGPGGSFGELALMYNAPRAATVVSTEPSTLWQLDRVTFRRILMDSAFNRRRMYESFLAEVQLLETLTDYERAKIADALFTEKHPAGFEIIKEGEPGENFYIVESGEAEVYKRGHDGPLKKYGKGDYFGELALLKNEPRAASVVSTSEIKLATLGKEGFQRLLGPVEDIMRRNDPSKREANAAQAART